MRRVFIRHFADLTNGELSDLLAHNSINFPLFREVRRRLMENSSHVPMCEFAHCIELSTCDKKSDLLNQEQFVSRMKKYYPEIEKWIKRCISEKRPILVYGDNFVILKEVKDRVKICSLFVSDERIGYGSALIGAAIDYAANKRAERVYIHVNHELKDVFSEFLKQFGPWSKGKHGDDIMFTLGMDYV